MLAKLVADFKNIWENRCAFNSNSSKFVSESKSTESPSTGQINYEPKYQTTTLRIPMKNNFYDYKPQMPRTSEQKIRAMLEDGVCAPHNKFALQLLDEHLELFKNTPGSSHNHQVWEGGYLDHVEQTMTIAGHLYDEWHDWQGELPFSKSDVLLIMFLHDLDKPFVKSGQWPNHSKKSRTLQKIAYIDQYFGRYNVKFSADQWNALEFVEGEGDDYSGERRVMGPLAALCHCADVMSARVWFDYPKQTLDKSIVKAIKPPYTTHGEENEK